MGNHQNTFRHGFHRRMTRSLSAKVGNCQHFLAQFGVRRLWIAFALCSPTLVYVSRYTKANHRIFMQFVRRDVWHVTFLEPGLQTPLPKTLTFKDEGKIRELARRGEAWQTLEDRQMLDYAIEKGEGGVYLRLSPGQYARLRRP
jgi:hypothetical protein